MGWLIVGFVAVIALLTLPAAFAEGQVDLTFNWWYVIIGILFTLFLNFVASILHGGEKKEEENFSITPRDPHEVDEIVDIHPGDTIVMKGEGKEAIGRSTQRVRLGVRRNRE